jgi:hypothetical protein
MFDCAIFKDSIEVIVAAVRVRWSSRLSPLCFDSLLISEQDMACFMKSFGILNNPVSGFRRERE